MSTDVLVGVGDLAVGVSWGAGPVKIGFRLVIAVVDRLVIACVLLAIDLIVVLVLMVIDIMSELGGFGLAVGRWA